MTFHGNLASFFFYQNQLINEFASTNLAKISREKKYIKFWFDQDKAYFVWGRNKKLLLF